jgi:hypothetical protein
MKANLTKLAAVLAVALFSAAAQAAPHEENVAQGQAAIINALVAGASVHAPAEIKTARETLELSRRAIAQSNFGEAIRLANMATETARAAEAKAIEERGVVRTASR